MKFIMRHVRLNVSMFSSRAFSWCLDQRSRTCMLFNNEEAYVGGNTPQLCQYYKPSHNNNIFPSNVNYSV